MVWCRYISDVISQSPGTSADIDYYWVRYDDIDCNHIIDTMLNGKAGKEVWQGDPTPPRDGWRTCQATSGETCGGAVDPPPCVISTLEVSASDSPSDSMVEMEI